jgi:excisionase family DNA binding protein
MRKEIAGGVMGAMQVTQTLRDEVLNYRKAAQLIGCTPGTLAVWVCTKRHGEIPHLKIGKIVRFRRADLAAWLETFKRGSSAQ